MGWTLADDEGRRKPPGWVALQGDPVMPPGSTAPGDRNRRGGASGGVAPAFNGAPRRNPKRAEAGGQVDAPFGAPPPRGEPRGEKGKEGPGAFPRAAEVNLCLEGTMNDRTDSRDNNPECKNPEWVKRYHAPQNRAAREADYLHRLRAAGIDPEAELPEDMDAYRYRLARMILMYVNDWPGCPLPICRRMRGCMAP